MLIHDENTKALKTLSAYEIKDLWDFHVRGCKYTLTQADFDRIVKEAYKDISSSFSDFDSDYSSLGSSVEVLMEISESFNPEVTSYDHISIDEIEITKLRSLKNVSSTGNEDDVTMESCIPRECVCIARPKGVKEEYFHFYVGVMEDFNIPLPFTDFEFGSYYDLYHDVS